MTTAAERLVALAGHGGTAGALLLAIGSGATAGAALVAYSGRFTGSAAAHLLTDVAVVTPPAPTDRPTTGGGGWRRVTGSAAPLQVLYRPRLIASGRSRAAVVATAEALLRLHATGASAAKVGVSTAGRQSALLRSEAVARLVARGNTSARASLATDMPIALTAGARGMAAAAIRAEHDDAITFAEAAVVLAWMRSRQ